MKKFESPELNIEALNVIDVITTSPGDEKPGGDNDDATAWG